MRSLAPDWTSTMLLGWAHGGRSGNLRQNSIPGGETGHLIRYLPGLISHLLFQEYICTFLGTRVPFGKTGNPRQSFDSVVKVTFMSGIDRNHRKHAIPFGKAAN